MLGDQQIVLRLQQVDTVIDRKFEIVAVRDCVFRASLNAEAAKYAAPVVYVVDLRVPLIDADALFRRTRIVRSLDVDAFGRARCST